MKDEIMLSDTFDHAYAEINDLIIQKKDDVKKAVNDAMISLYWEIGKRLTEEITGVNKPEYGKRVVIEISNRLSVDYGYTGDSAKVKETLVSIFNQNNE